MTIEELERLRLKQRCFYTKEETKELLKNISLKVEVEELPATGIENYMYLVPALTEGHYNQFIWNDNQWLSLGESEEDFTNYVTGPELTSAIYLYCPIIEDDRNGNSAPIKGNAPFKTLKNGQIILLHIKYKTYSNATLNLTLSDGTSTGAKDIKMQSTESIVLVKKINTNYGSHVVWSYIPMVYDLLHDCWICLSSIDTYPFMTSALIQVGNSTEGKTVTPKLLRDNFYTESEVNNLLKNKLNIITYDDNPTISLDTVTLDSTKYIGLGEIDLITINLPSYIECPANYYDYTISGGTNIPNDIESWFNTKKLDYLDNDYPEELFELDKSVAMEIVATLQINGGTENTYTISEVGWYNLLEPLAHNYNLLFEATDESSETYGYLVPDYSPSDEFSFSFTCSSDNCSLTLPTNVKYGSNLDFDNDKQEDRKFQFSIQDNIALYTYVD